MLRELFSDQWEEMTDAELLQARTDLAGLVEAVKMNDKEKSLREVVNKLELLETNNENFII
jgi:hypothetical protein